MQQTLFRKIMEKKMENKVGRPLKFKSVEELEKKIDNYFKYCEEKHKPLTITGLALAIGMTSRRQLLEYQRRDEFHNAIRKAKLICENYVEQYLFTGKNMAGAIFNLKNNYKWEEQTKLDLTSKGKPLPLLSNLRNNDHHGNQENSETSEED